MSDKKKTARTSAAPRRQGGGFAIGLIIGLLIGLGLALGVALYVTKVPVPFVNKVPQRDPEKDAAEAEKNKNWDPNSPLYGKNPARPNAAASATPPAAPPTVAAQPGPDSGLPAPAVNGNPGITSSSTATAPAPSPAASRAAQQSTRDPAAILSGATPPPPAQPKLASALPSNGGAPGPAGVEGDPFIYYVQAGAYGRTEDAEQQRAKLAMLGVEGKLTERDQGGHTVYRVRVGPFERKADADAAKDKLSANGLEAALVRVQR